MKLAFAIFLFIALIFIGVRAYSFFAQAKALNENLSEVETKLANAKSDEADLQAETEYLSNPNNLEKELRSQFNYKRPGETMVIIVPAQTSTNNQ
jgi:cell division protein FtsB